MELRGADGALVRELTPPGFGYRSLAGVYEQGGSRSLSRPAPTQPNHRSGSCRLQAGRRHCSPTARVCAPCRSQRQRPADGGLLQSVRRLDRQPSPGRRRPRRRSPAVGRRSPDPTASASNSLARVANARTTPTIVRPRDFQAGRNYPVILTVYAGPQFTVTSASLRRYLGDQWMADQDARRRSPGRPRHAVARSRLGTRREGQPHRPSTTRSRGSSSSARSIQNSICPGSV